MVKYLRKTQLCRLNQEIGIPSEEFPVPRLPSALFIWGPPSSGKTYFLNKVLKKTKIKHIIRVAASGILQGSRAFLESIVLQLHHGSQEQNQNPISIQPSENYLTEFLLELKLFCRQVMSENGGTHLERVIIVINKAQLLYPEHTKILHFFQRCQEFTGHNLCVIFCSRYHPMQLFNYNLPYGFDPMCCISFPGYTIEEMIAIIVHNHPAGPGRIFEDYLFYVSSVVTNLRNTCQDLLKLWRFLNLHHPEFEKCRADDGDLGAFCRRLVLVFKDEAQVIDKNSIPGSAVICSTRHTVQEVSDKCLGMSIVAKKLLIAAYLASKNPILFVQRNQDSKKEEPNGLDVDDIQLDPGGSQSEAVPALDPEPEPVPAFDPEPDPVPASYPQPDPEPGFDPQPDPTEPGLLTIPVNVTSGPIIFSEERLQSIYSKVVGRPCVLNSDYLYGITVLCDLKLLARFDDSLDNCKFRCLAHKDLIRKICASIEFPLEKYLTIPVPSIQYQ